MAFYIEHDELEKVHTAIVRMKSYVKTENFSEVFALSQFLRGKSGTGLRWSLESFTEQSKVARVGR